VRREMGIGRDHRCNLRKPCPDIYIDRMPRPVRRGVIEHHGGIAANAGDMAYSVCIF
jgi:hypothetical protein